MSTRGSPCISFASIWWKAWWTDSVQEAPKLPWFFVLFSNICRIVLENSIVIDCDTERCWLCRDFYRVSLQHYILCRFSYFITDTWKDDNFFFRPRDLKSLLSNPFCNSILKEFLPWSRLLKHVWRHGRTFQFYLFLEQFCRVEE